MVEGRKVGERKGERDTYTQPLVASPHTPTGARDEPGTQICAFDEELNP